MSTLARGILIAWAFASTAVYAVHPIWLSSANAPLWQLGVGIGASAGVSWLALGTAILASPERRARLTDWFDACLRIMAVGDAILMLGVAFSAFWDEGQNIGVFNTAQVLVLIVSGTTMTALWFRAANRLGTNRATAAALWFGALNGTFIIAFTALAWPLTYGPWLTGIGNL